METDESASVKARHPAGRAAEAGEALQLAEQSGGGRSVGPDGCRPGSRVRVTITIEEARTLGIPAVAAPLPHGGGAARAARTRSPSSGDSTSSRRLRGPAQTCA